MSRCWIPTLSEDALYARICRLTTNSTTLFQLDRTWLEKSTKRLQSPPFRNVGSTSDVKVSTADAQTAPNGHGRPILDLDRQPFVTSQSFTRYQSLRAGVVTMLGLVVLGSDLAQPR